MYKIDNFGKIKALSEQHGGKRAILERIEFKHEYDEHADVSYLEDSAVEYPEDLNRLASFERGEWHCIGIRAVATIYIPCGGGSFKVQKIETAGLWGIESDSEQTYFNEVEANEKEELLEYLEILNVDISLLAGSDLNK
ncbi:hypothetical protein ABES02_29790 [Neobacillus pocheonensis]|uniref:hypothetical protein n=1 Tax=Neobacillus pocheonensis TaxID=363869 RepID=UPI003D2CC27E